MPSCLRPSLLFAAAALWACSDRSATAIVVATNADPSVLSRIDALVLTATRGDRSWTQRYELPASKALPGTITFRPENPDQIPGEALSVRVTGVAGAAEIITRTARMSFLKEHTKLLRVGLSNKCLTEVDPCKNIPGKTCDNGLCVDEQIDSSTLPEFESTEQAIDPTLFPGLEGTGGSAGGGSCEALLPLSLEILSSPQEQIPADTPFSVSVKATGGSGAYLFKIVSDQGVPIASASGTNSAPVSMTASAQFCSQSFFVHVSDASCAAVPGSSQPLALSVGLGTWVSPDCAPGTELECGSQLFPWCSIAKAQESLQDAAKSAAGGITLRLLSGANPFPGPVEMIHNIHLEGGYPADFSSQVPVDSAPLPVISASTSDFFTVRWKAPLGAAAPLKADLGRVKVETPDITGKDFLRALSVEGLVEANLRLVEVPSRKVAASQGAALLVSNGGAKVRMTDCTLEGPQTTAIPQFLPTSYGIEAIGDEISLEIHGGKVSGGPTIDPSSSSESLGLNFEDNGAGSLLVDAASLLGAPAPGAGNAIGMRLVGLRNITIQGTKIQGGQASSAGIGVVLTGKLPDSFLFSKSTVEGLLGGSGEGRGVLLGYLEPPADQLPRTLSFQQSTLRGATGGSPPVAIGLDASWSRAGDNTTPMSLEVEALQCPEIAGATGKSNAKIAKGVYSAHPLSGFPIDEQTLAVVSLKQSTIAGGTSGVEERVGGWFVDTEVHVDGGDIRGTTATGGRIVHGLVLLGDKQAPNAELKGTTSPLLIEGGPSQRTPQEELDTSGITVDGIGHFSVDGAIVHGCGAQGCDGAGVVRGIALNKVTNAEVIGCDISAGFLNNTTDTEGELTGVEVAGSETETTINGQVQITQNKSIVGAEGGAPIFRSIGVKIESGPVVLQDNGDIRGGRAKETFGVSANLQGTPTPAKYTAIERNVIRGGEGPHSVGVFLRNFVESRLNNNRIDGQGQSDSSCGSGTTSRGIDVGWLPASMVINNMIFGGGTCESIACSLDTMGDPPSLLEEMVVAHNLCLGVGNLNGAAGSLANGLVVHHRTTSSPGNKRLLFLGNLFGAAPSSPSMAGAPATRVVAELQLPDGNDGVPELIQMQSSRYLLVQPGGQDAFIKGQNQEITSADPSGSFDDTGVTSLDNQAVSFANNPQIFASPDDASPLDNPGGYLINNATCSLNNLLYSYASVAPDTVGTLSTIPNLADELATDIGKLQRAPGGNATAGPDECGPLSSSSERFVEGDRAGDADLVGRDAALEEVRQLLHVL